MAWRGTRASLLFSGDMDRPAYAHAVITVEVGEKGVELGDVRVVRAKVTSWEQLGEPGFEVAEEVRLIVRRLEEGGPAARAGMAAGDEIVSVGGHDVTGARAYLFWGLSALPAGEVLDLGLAGGRRVRLRLDEQQER